MQRGGRGAYGGYRGGNNRGGRGFGPSVNVFKLHPCQSGNPALQMLVSQCELDDTLCTDIYVKGLNIGILYLESSFHTENPKSIEEKLKYCQKGRENQTGKLKFIAYIMDTPEGKAAVSKLNILAVEFGYRLLLLESPDDFKTYIHGIQKMALVPISKGN